MVTAKALPSVGVVMRVMGLTAALLSAACATTLVRATPDPAEGQDAVYTNGIPILSSRGSRSDVALAPSGGPTGRYELGRRIPFFVFVRNRSGSRTLVSENSIRASASSAWGSEAANVLHATDVEDQVRADAAWARGVNAFAFAASALSNAGAGTTYHRLQVGGTTVQGTSYSPAAAAQAQRESAADAAGRADRIATNEQATLSRVSQLLQSNTLEPGEAVSGGILIERPRLAGCDVSSGEPFRCTLWITVDVSGELHRFTFVEEK